MQYAILCYSDEDVVGSWTKEEDEACMARLLTIQERLHKEGRLGPVLRLLPTTAATTLRKGKDEPLVLDGPFAETKEQLAGFYLVEARDLNEAIQLAGHIPAARVGCVEVRPVRELQV